MSSVASARALPAPGPATVRLALIRTGIEVFGIKYATCEMDGDKEENRPFLRGIGELY
jgi:hypothetical protein